jgi:hypothetical protein
MELSSTSATGWANARANIAIKLFMLQKYNTPAKYATPIYGGIGNFLLYVISLVVLNILVEFHKIVYAGYKNVTRIHL